MSDTSAANRLSKEALTKILLFYQEVAVSCPAPPPIPQYATPFQWLPAMLVCRHWRDLTLEIAPLWSTLNLGYRRCYHLPGGIHHSEDDLETQLQRELRDSLHQVLPRAANEPLDLSFFQNDFLSDPLPLLADVFHRIRSLRYRHYYDAPMIPSALASVLKNSMVALLQLDTLSGEWNVTYVFKRKITEIRLEDVTILQQNFPSLRILRLEAVTLPEQSLSLFPQLITLDLRACAFRSGPKTFHDFLDLLEGCSNLTELQLHSVLQALVRSESTVRNMPRRIGNGSLRTLIVNDLVDSIHAFLENLDIPLDVSLLILGVIDGAGLGDRNFPNLPLLYELLSSTNRGRLPHLQAATTIHFGNQQIRASGPSATLGRETVLDLGVCVNSSDGRLLFPYTTEDNVQAFRTILGGVPIARLRVCAGMMTLRRVSLTQTWVDFLAALPELRALEVLGAGSFMGLVCALGYAPSRSGDAAEGEARKDSPTDAPVCPHLECFEANGGNWEPGLIEAAVATLARRCGRGLPPLKRLSFRLSTNMEKHSPHSMKALFHWMGEQYADECLRYAREFEWMAV